jgi:hypothetical protein
MRLGCTALVTGDRAHFGSFYGQTLGGVAIHYPRGLRPVGPRYARRNAPAYRAPLGRMNCSVIRDPARWAGLRNRGPLARTHRTHPAHRTPQTPSAKGASFLSPAHRAGSACRQIMRPERPR